MFFLEFCLDPYITLTPIIINVIFLILIKFALYLLFIYRQCLWGFLLILDIYLTCNFNKTAVIGGDLIFVIVHSLIDQYLRYLFK